MDFEVTLTGPAWSFEKHHRLADLSLPEFDAYQFPVYIVDYDWVYRYANPVAQSRIPFEIVGMHIEEVQKRISSVNFQPVYNMLKDGVNNRTRIQLRSRSPLTGKAIDIHGYPLEDCYVFSITELPDKEELISELKDILRNKE